MHLGRFQPRLFREHIGRLEHAFQSRVLHEEVHGLRPCGPYHRGQSGVREYRTRVEFRSHDTQCEVVDFETGIVYVDDVALQEDYTYTPTNVEEGIVFPIKIADGCIFVMGDNRNGSKDSRHPEIGMIDEREILGKAIFLIFPGTGEGNNIAPREFDRIGALK